MNSLTEKSIDLVIRFRWLLFVVAILAALAAVPSANELVFDRSIENMFSADDPLMASYRKLKRTFGGNEIVLAVYRDPDLFAPDGSGLQRLSEIRRQCEQVPGVRAVLSIDRPLSLLSPNGALSERIRRLFEDYTHSKDGRTVAAVCMLEPKQRSQVPRRETIDRLQELVDHIPGDLAPGFITGEPVMILDGFRYLERDGRRLGWWSTALLALAIVVCFRSLRWVLVPIAVVQWSLLMTRAALVTSDLRLSMVSSMLTSIVTVIGVATVVHVTVRFREGRVLGLSSRGALHRAGVLLARPIFWACATDAVGFVALVTASVGPIRDFGFMMAIGSLFVLPAVALLVPALALIRPQNAVAVSRGERRISNSLAACLAWMRAYQPLLAALLVAATCLALLGISSLQVETDFSKNFRASSRVVTSYQFVEDRLGGAGVIDVILPAPRELDGKYLNRVAAVQRRLRDELVHAPQDAARLTKVMSIADAVEATSLIELSPELARNKVITATLLLIRSQMPDFVAALHAPDPEAGDKYYFRIMLRAYERQPARSKLHLIQEIQRICDEEFGTDVAGDRPQVTGFYVLLANLVASVLNDQWKTFAIALTGIAVMLCLAFRSPRLAMIAILPNALPIVFVLGVLGWTGGRVNMGVAMIAAVSMGLSVDSAIHYITFFLAARTAGKSVHDSIDEVQRTVGLAVVFSTLALVIGFCVLCTSEFLPTAYFGLLVGISMLGGLLGNLVLLPLLLAAFCGERRPHESEQGVLSASSRE